MNYDQLLAIVNQRITYTSDNIPQNAFDIALQLNIRTKNHIECKYDFTEECYPLKDADAVLAMNNGEYTIYYDENNPYSNFAIAHEIAHYLLNHTTDGTEQHHDAQLMAAIIITPPDRISFKGIKSSAELSVTYKIPTDVAEIYWHEIYKHQVKPLSLKPKIALITGVITLIIISLFACFAGKLSVLQGESTSPIEVEAEYNQSTIVHTTPPTIIPKLSDSVSQNTVYVTSSGKKYHKVTCRHIKRSKNLIEFSFEDAINAGYEPCKDCIQ